MFGFLSTWTSTTKENKVEEALTKLKEQFPNPDLTDLEQLLKDRVKNCPLKQECVCSDPDKLFEGVSSIITRDEKLFRTKIGRFLTPDVEFIEVSPYESPLKPENLVEVYRGVKNEDIARFFARLNADFLRTSTEPRFNFAWHAQCDCYKFIQYKFPHVSQGSYKRVNFLLRNYADPPSRHAAVALMVFSYFVENKLSDTPEMAPSRARLHLPPRLHHWLKIMNKHITREHARDRMKALGDYQITNQADEPARLYQEIFDGWKQDFPLFFTVDGNVNENALKYPELGPTFVCVKCNQAYIETNAISCTKPSSQINEVYPMVHTSCRKCIREEIKFHFKLAVNSSGVGMKCFHDLCTNPLIIENFIRFVEVDEREKIRLRILSALVKDLGHDAVKITEVPDAQEDSDSDENLALPEESRVLALDN